MASNQIGPGRKGVEDESRRGMDRLGGGNAYCQVDGIGRISDMPVDEEWAAEGNSDVGHSAAVIDSDVECHGGSSYLVMMGGGFHPFPLKSFPWSKVKTASKAGSETALKMMDQTLAKNVITFWSECRWPA